MSEGQLKPLQFSLKTLIVSTSIVGIGIGCYLVGSAYLTEFLKNPSPDNRRWWGVVVAGVQCLAAPPLIWAGMLAPFHRMRLGAWLGIGTEIILICVRPLGRFYISPGTSLLSAIILACLMLVLILEWSWRLRQFPKISD